MKEQIHMPTAEYLLGTTLTEQQRQTLLYEALGDTLRDRIQEAMALVAPPASAAPAVTRVLEVGCSQGHFIADLLQAYPQVDMLGLDINGNSIAYAQEHVVCERARFQTHDITEPLPDTVGGDFSLAMASLVLCHIKKPDQALTHMAAALQPGKVLFLRDPDFESFWFPHPALDTLLRVLSEAITHVAGQNFARRHYAALLNANLMPLTSYYLHVPMGGPTWRGRQLLHNFYDAVKIMRPHITGSLHLLDPHDFDRHIAACEQEVTANMEGEIILIDTIARKPPAVAA
jgi:SAM-dependent methyltransferase